MDLLFLGTSAGTPTRARNVTALALLEARGKGWCLVDCGEGTQHRLLQAPLSLHDLQAILVTHVHGDHCYGLPGLLASAGLQGRRQPLTIIAPAGIEEWLRATQRLSQLLLPYPLQFLATEALGLWHSGSWLVDRFALSHRAPSFAYRFTEARPHARLDQARLLADGVPRGPLWGELRQGRDLHHAGRTLHGRDYLIYPDPPRRVVVAGDNDRPELLRQACAGAQLLVHEATYTADVAVRVGPVGHSSAAQVAAFAEAVALPQLLLTHFSPRYQPDPARSPSIEDIRREAASHYGGRLWLAEDLARYHLDRQGRLSRRDPAGRVAGD